MFKRFKWKKKLVHADNSPAATHQGKTLEMQVSLENEAAPRGKSVYLFPVSIKEIGGSKWGYMNSKGKLVIKQVYDFAGEFQENGLAVVRLKGLSGIIDTSGYFIVKPKYDTINPFFESRATVIDQQEFKVIDESGKELTSSAYSFIGDFKEGRVLFSKLDSKGRNVYGFLNRWGKEVIAALYESASDFTAGKSVVKVKEGAFALINLTGKELQMYNFAFAGDYGEGLLAFQKISGGKFGYVDEQGKVVIEPKFNWVSPFQDGCAIVKFADGKHDFSGMIDKQGQYILKPNYQEIINLGEGRVAIGKAIDPEKPFIGSLYALGDTKGHILTGFIFNKIAKFENGMASASNDNFTFFIDKKGRKIPNLPIIKGNGELRFIKTLIKGDIDFRLLYFQKDGELLWKQKNLIPLQEPYAVMEQKYKPNKDFLVYYPQITGMLNRKKQDQINQDLKDLAGIKETSAHLQLESNYFSDFEVIFYKKDLLVIEINGYNYQFGAAHGMPLRKYVHIDLNSGNIFHLKDLFKPSSTYVKVLSELIGIQMKHNPKYTYVFPGAYKGIQVDQPFFISDEGLNIYFAPYEIAPFAAGFPVFTISFEELSHIIDLNGGFWKAFH